MNKCAICHESVKSGVVVHSECLEQLQKTRQLDDKPLTIEELRGTAGEPVWVVSLGATLPKGDGWYLGVERWAMEGYGSTWIAYRYKPREWISVKDCPPPEGEKPFLVFSKWGHISIMRRRGWGDPDWLAGGYLLGRDITHWMPLPEPPEAE